MSRFIVLTVDHNEQQAFVDYADAGNHESALETVLKYRDYCCHGMAYTPAELREFADSCKNNPVDFFEEVD